MEPDRLALSDSSVGESLSDLEHLGRLGQTVHGEGHIVGPVLVDGDSRGPLDDTSIRRDQVDHRTSVIDGGVLVEIIEVREERLDQEGSEAERKGLCFFGPGTVWRGEWRGPD